MLYPTWPPSVSPEGCRPPHGMYVPLQVDVSLGCLNTYAYTTQPTLEIQLCSHMNAIWLQDTNTSKYEPQLCISLAVQAIIVVNNNLVSRI